MEITYKQVEQMQSEIFGLRAQLAQAQAKCDDLKSWLKAAERVRDEVASILGDKEGFLHVTARRVIKERDEAIARAEAAERERDRLDGKLQEVQKLLKADDRELVRQWDRQSN